EQASRRRPPPRRTTRWWSPSGSAIRVEVSSRVGELQGERAAVLADRLRLELGTNRIRIVSVEQVARRQCQAEVRAQLPGDDAAQQKEGVGLLAVARAAAGLVDTLHPGVPRRPRRGGDAALEQELRRVAGGL